MNKKQLFKFYERLYFHELEMREKITARINIPLAIIITLLGFLGYQINSIITLKFTVSTIIAGCFLIMAIAALIIGTYLLIRSWFDYEYSFLPDASELKIYRIQLIEYYKNENEFIEMAYQEFSDDVMESYINCASKNSINNDAKSTLLYMAIYWIIGASILSFISILPTLLCQIFNKF